MTLGGVPLRYWAVRLGEGGKYVDSGWKGRFIAVGWNDLGDLTWLSKIENDDDSLDKLSKLVERTYLGDSKVQQSINTGFVKEDWIESRRDPRGIHSKIPR